MVTDRLLEFHRAWKSSWPDCKQHREDANQIAELIHSTRVFDKPSKIKALGRDIEMPSRGRVCCGLQGEPRVL